MPVMPANHAHLPQGPFMWNTHPQGPFIQGPGMFLPNPQMVWGQVPHPQVGKMENEGGCMQNSQLQVHMPHTPLAPYVIPCPPQQTYMGNLNEGACMQNPPPEMYTEKPAIGSFMQYVLEKP